MSPDEAVRAWPKQDIPATIPGRRFRVVMRLLATPVLRAAGLPDTLTYREAFTALDGAALFAALPLRDRPRVVHAAGELNDRDADNPALPEALQDLADEVIVDATEACGALRDPDLWYPGVDEGIEPVSDEHVKLVIAAMQRELNRELRPHWKRGYPSPNLPAVPLASLPWRIQRALAERRRLRFAQWGIGRAEWESGTWSAWACQEDPDWLPRWPLEQR